MKYFLLVLFALKICFYPVSIWPCFCHYVFITIPINKFTIKCFVKETTNFSSCFNIFLNSLLSTTLKDIVLLLSKCLTQPIIWKSFIHNGLMSSPSLYPLKCLNDLFVPYVSFFKTNILSISISKYFFAFVKIIISLFFCRRKLCSFHSCLYLAKTKTSKIFFIIIWVCKEWSIVSWQV